MDTRRVRLVLDGDRVREVHAELALLELPDPRVQIGGGRYWLAVALRRAIRAADFYVRYGRDVHECAREICLALAEFHRRAADAVGPRCSIHFPRRGRSVRHRG